MFASRAVCRVAIVLACAVGVTVGVGAEQAAAQRGGMAMGMRGGPGGGFAAPISKADLKKFGATLALDADQLSTAEVLLEAMQAEHDVIAKQARKEMDRIRMEFEDSRDPSIWRDEFPKAMEAYQKGSQSLEKQFFEDVKMLLTPAQTERWPKVERLHRRIKSLPAGMLSGESVDLIATVEQLKLETPPAELTATLDRYEADMDRALIDRDKLREERTAGMMRGGFNFDMEQLRKDMAELRKAGLTVCEVNQRYARTVEATLPEERRAEFAQQVRVESFPRVYRETHTGKCVKAAAGFTDLSGEQKATIAELLATYEREVKSLNSKWADAVQASEADGGGDPMAMFMGGGEDGAVADARKAKRELDRVTREKLMAVLNEEQKERLPEREDESQGGMMFRMGG